MTQPTDASTSNVTGWRASAEAIAKAQAIFPTVNFEEANVPPYTLEAVLPAGLTRDQWPAHREAIVERFRDGSFGCGLSKPQSLAFDLIETDPAALDSKATLKRVRITSGHHGKTHAFEMVLYVPNDARKPAPAFLLINIKDPSHFDASRTPQPDVWRAERLIGRGFALASFQRTDLAIDKPDAWRSGAARLFDDESNAARPDDAFGALAVWAWGASRVMDYLETDASIDQSQVVVVGHSRGGKTALWAGATDTRFAIAISNNSGCGGASLNCRNIGETPLRLSRQFPHWMNANYRRSAEAGAMPFEQHLLLASISPRAVYVCSAADDLWADPKGEYESWAAASPAFELFGDPPVASPDVPPVNTPLIVGRRGYHIRTGAHEMGEYDWDRFADFAAAQFGIAR